MEVFWSGDLIVWRNLLRHYLLCLATKFCRVAECREGPQRDMLLLAAGALFQAFRKFALYIKCDASPATSLAFEVRSVRDAAGVFRRRAVGRSGPATDTVTV